MNIVYNGKVSSHLGISFKNLVLTILTLGIYRFWGKTNLRSYIWSHFEIFNYPLIYHGTASELLKAFLRVIPFYVLFIIVQNLVGWLITYLGAEQKIVIDVLFGFFYFLQFLGLIWIIEFAIYSKHQYLYSRTTWQGIRFSLKGARTAYANLAFSLFIKSIITLGFKDHIYFIKKSQFMYENTSWGDVPLNFTGNSQDLKRMNYLTLLLAIPTFFMSRLYFAIYCIRYAANHLSMQNVRLKANYTVFQLLRYMLANLLITIFSLGMALPYVSYRNLKFMQKYYDLEGDQADLSAKQSTDETSGRDGLAALFDIADF
ncbi:DUF898 family protein [Candidatus Finniella inopinata]|uniref:DUF898 family protein n=1 Tax=Candidatus Finniella inopinata TaxID=1696036 RepID=A0A4Q7DH48_9PROT|nr:DUF898 family protein [Candidatus Finniella inopinata]RZI45365.1 DUF898 family protein [Candidatus Finniella inopinata]